ncbi:MAG: holo-ACP synthase [Erysipelotrichales bacterium]
MLLKCKVGTDIVYMPRFNDKLDNKRFINKILTNNEKEMYYNLESLRRRLEFLSGRFALKEAFAKAKGKGIGDLSFIDIEVSKDEYGAPYIEGVEASISLSHDTDYCIAVVIVGD